MIKQLITSSMITSSVTSTVEDVLLAYIKTGKMGAADALRVSNAYPERHYEPVPGYVALVAANPPQQAIWEPTTALGTISRTVEGALRWCEASTGTSRGLAVYRVRAICVLSHAALQQILYLKGLEDTPVGEELYKRGISLVANDPVEATLVRTQ